MPTVARRYRLTSQAGSGGMAEVWRAVDTRLDRTVAVKLLLPELSGEARARERAVAEARAAARISHPNVAALYDAGHRLRGLRRPVPYLVMEYVDGETLDRRLVGGSALDWPDAARIAVEVAEALAAAHRHGVVHRDIKPGNIMLTASGVKVVDFGLASIIGTVHAGRAGVLLGTPEYMAPEQLRDEAVTAAADLYALGLVVYHMLTGALPWTVTARRVLVRQRHAWGPVRLPPTAGVPAEIVAAVDACLADEPDLRPSAQHVASDLRAALARHPHTEAAPAAPATSYLPERPRHPCLVPWRSRPVRRWPRRAALAAGVALIGAAGWARPLWATPVATASDEPSPAPPMCTVQYVGHRTPPTFTADLSIDGNVGKSWVVRFTAPPGQRITRASGAAWSQSGSLITVTGTGPLTARVSFTLAGAIDRADAGFPAAFELDGVPCQHRVSIHTVSAADA
ncbi:serine/threonine-protein kinase [Dactylosporangium sp. CA-092794]|uniref:serine/threonine-protein kinase n=1 Tax=Dactylosporangium sp. CA-092794 TaxID=3239929 RepID=UPI003D916AEC